MVAVVEVGDTVIHAMFDDVVDDHRRGSDVVMLSMGLF